MPLPGTWHNFGGCDCSRLQSPTAAGVAPSIDILDAHFARWVGWTLLLQVWYSGGGEGYFRLQPQVAAVVALSADIGDAG